MITEEAKKNAAESRKCYDKENMARLAVKLPKPLAHDCKKLAEQQNATVSRLLANHIRQTLRFENQFPAAVKEPATPMGFALYTDTVNALIADAARRDVPLDVLVSQVLTNYVEEQERERTSRIRMRHEAEREHQARSEEDTAE